MPLDALAAATAQIKTSAPAGPVIQAFFDQPTFTVSYVVHDPVTARAAIIDSVLDYDPASGRTSTTSADAIIAHVCHLTGWTWDYCEDTLTVARLRALCAEWQRHPPLPLLFAAWLGVKPQESGTPEELVERIRGMGRR